MSMIHAITQGALAELVAFLWLSEQYTQPHAAESVLPTGTMSLVLSLDDQGQFGGVISGARSKSVVLDTSRPLNLMGVVFHPGAGFPFSDCPAGELQDLSLPLERLWGRSALTLHEQILLAPNPTEKFHVLESTLRARLHHAPPGHPAIRYAVKSFLQSDRPRSVASVVEKTGLTARRFINTFRNEVGVSPKVFCRITRFRTVIETLESSPSIDWSAIAADSGYFDQAHFIHDFRAFAGVTPSDYIRYRTSANHVRVPGS